MNPTNEQELRELFVMYGYPRLTQAELKLIPAIEHYIIADRKRVELEARLNELENNKWLPNEAKWIEQEAERIAELKAQQEEL